MDSNSVDCVGGRPEAGWILYQQTMDHGLGTQQILIQQIVWADAPSQAEFSASGLWAKASEHN